MERPEVQCHLWLHSNEANLGCNKLRGGDKGVEESLKGKDWGIVLIKIYCMY